MLCRILVGACLILATGCSETTATSKGWEKNPTRLYSYVIEDGFTIAHRQQIKQGIRTWEASLNGFLAFQEVVVDLDGKAIRFHPTTVAELDRAHPHDDAKDSSRTIGYCKYQGIGSKIDLSEDLSDEKFQWVLLHEVGHALGLAHSASDTLMCYKDSCAVSRITDNDLSQFYAIWDPSEKR